MSSAQENLDDLSSIKTFIDSKTEEGTVPYRLIYMFGGANLTHFRHGKDSDLGLLLQLLNSGKNIEEETDKDGRKRMTYVFCFDQRYSLDNIEYDVQKINKDFMSMKSKIKNKKNPISEYTENIGPRAAGASRRSDIKSSHTLELKNDTIDKGAAFPQRYSYGSHCYIFFLNSYLQSNCAKSDSEMREQIKKNGINYPSSVCEIKKGSAFAYLQSLILSLLPSLEGELYLYNCAWENINAPGGVSYTGNQYFESFPEVLMLATKNMSGGKFRSYFLYNFFMNLFTTESVVVSSTMATNRGAGHLREAKVTEDTEFLIAASSSSPKANLEGGRTLKRRLRKSRTKTLRKRKTRKLTQ
jgi:hypothetical protein